MVQMKVSVIVTVLNERASIGALLASLAAQTRPPDEIVVVDGGSTDGTMDVIASYLDKLPLKLLFKSGTNISQGRNEAIRSAAGEIIASTDAGTRLVPEWLAELAAPIERGEAAVTAGFFLPDPQSAFETALGATTLPELRDVEPGKFMPSSRSVAFRKSAWEAVGGYPEWLDYCEDLVFDFALDEQFGPFAFAPGAIARFRPRPTLGAFAKQYYRYARGDGKADLWRMRQAARYGTYLVAVPLIFVGGLLLHPAVWLLYLLGAAAMFAKPYRRLVPWLRGMSRSQRFKALAWVPVIRVMGDWAKMAGYPAGVWWRFKNRKSIPPHPRR
jgi:glycosyltransferase involved in cell wall biosynthesis